MNQQSPGRIKLVPVVRVSLPLTHSLTLHSLTQKGTSRARFFHSEIRLLVLEVKNWTCRLRMHCQCVLTDTSKENEVHLMCEKKYGRSAL